MKKRQSPRRLRREDDIISATKSEDRELKKKFEKEVGRERKDDTKSEKAEERRGYKVGEEVRGESPSGN